MRVRSSSDIANGETNVGRHFTAFLGFIGYHSELGDARPFGQQARADAFCQSGVANRDLSFK